MLHLCSSLGADCNTPQGCCLCFSHNEPLREDIKRRHSWSWAPSLPALPKINPLLSCWWCFKPENQQTAQTKAPHCKGNCLQPVGFGSFVYPKTRSCSHTRLLQPCNCPSSPGFDWKTMQFDLIQPDSAQAQSSGIKLNSTKSRKVQGYNMWSSKSVKTDSRFSADEKKIMLCFSLGPEQKEKEVLGFLKKPIKLIRVSEASPKGRIFWIKENNFLWISILNYLLPVKSAFTHLCFSAKPAA